MNAWIWLLRVLQEKIGAAAVTACHRIAYCMWRPQHRWNFRVVMSVKYPLDQLGMYTPPTTTRVNTRLPSSGLNVAKNINLYFVIPSKNDFWKKWFLNRENIAIFFCVAICVFQFLKFTLILNFIYKDVKLFLTFFCFIKVYFFFVFSYFCNKKIRFLKLFDIYLFYSHFTRVSPVAISAF